MCAQTPKGITENESTIHHKYTIHHTWWEELHNTIYRKLDPHSFHLIIDSCPCNIPLIRTKLSPYHGILRYCRYYLYGHKIRVRKITTIKRVDSFFLSISWSILNVKFRQIFYSFIFPSIHSTTYLLDDSLQSDTQSFTLNSLHSWRYWGWGWEGRVARLGTRTLLFLPMLLIPFSIIFCYRMHGIQCSVEP